ncbi:MAG TPA: hypothetical protein VML19_18500 [Verrucomicrobiae bacterium]|nr:hypothetical protein [Verrucomicrobiae bacterium]
MKRYAILSLLASVLLLTGAAHAQTLVANPNPINLFAQAGGNPVTANLNFTSSDNVTPLSFSIAAGNPWITLSAAPSGGWKSPATVVVTVNPATLNSGANSGSISVFFNNSTFIVPVNVTVSSISVFPTSINLGSYQAGSTIYPQSQTLTVSGAGGQPAGNFTLSKASADTWYTAAAFGNPLSGIVVSFNSAAASTLTPNTTPLQGTLTITPSGSNPVPVTVPISLTVTASPQVTVSPTSLTFNWQAGGTNNQTTQTLTLSTNSSQPVNFTVTRQNANWLSLPASNPTSVSSSASAQVSVVVDGSNQTNTSGSLILNVSGALFPNGTTQMTIPVALNVSNSPLLYLTSASALTFSYQFGGATLQSSQNVTLASSGAPNVGQQLSYNVSVSANAPFTIAPTGTLTTPTGFSVTANAAGLSPGSYSGTITVTPVASGSGQGPITIPVTLNVTFTPILLVSTTQLVFPWQVGQAAPSSQTVSLSSSTGAPLNYTISPPAVSWLQVTSSTGSTSGTTDQTFFTVTPVIGSVTAQTSPLDATITVTPTDPNTGATLNTVSIDVKLYASATPVLIVSPTGPLQFSTWPNAPAYPLASSCSSGSQLCTINLTSSSSAPADILSVTGVQRTVASQSITGEWVGGTNPAGNTPANFTVNATQLSATAMPAGTYSGTVSITATNSGGTAVADSPFSLPVLFTVNSAKGSVVTPQPDGSMQFTQAQNGNAPASQTVQVNTDGVSLPFTAVVNTGPLSWLSVSKINGPTPGSFNVQANAANLTTGTYHGAIYVSIPNAESSPIRIPVTFTVTGGSIAASQSSLTFTQILGASPATAQTVQITSNPTSVNFTASTSVTTPAGGNWLSAAITAGSGSTPGTVTVSITPGSLAVGQYSGAVTVTSTGVAGSPITIPVTLNVVQATISAPTTPLTFNQLAGGPAPANQTLQVTSTPGPIGFTVSTSTNNGTGWLTATVGSSGTSGTTPANVVVSVNGATLSPGPYSGLVTITSASATGSPITIPIALNVGTAITLTPSQTSLTFSAVVGQTTPSQTVALTSTGSTQFTAAATTTSGGNWLSVSPTSGTATTSATTLTIAAATASLTAGNYSGIVSITSSSSLTPITINVSLTVSAIPTPVIGGVANAASYATGSISPGENITIYGTGIGPAQIVGAQLTSSGKVSTNVGQTQVTFDGIAAPIIYASATQTSVMVPYEIGGRASTSMQITYSGVSSASIPYTVVPAIPGLYTQNLQGTGPGVILNPDGVTVNGPTKPAPAGSEVALYMTGEGATSPASTTGGVAGSTGNGLNTPLLNVTATIAGLPATVVYKGSAPGDVYGIMQLNLIIPSNAPSGAQPIVITVGSTSTQSGVTIQIQ